MIAVGQDPAGPGLGMLARRIAHGTEPAATGVDLSIYDLLPKTTRAHLSNTQEVQVGA